MAHRITQKVLQELVSEYAERHGKQIGNRKGNILLRETDGRIAPYNYKLVEFVNDSGAQTIIQGASTARQRFDFLTSH